MRIILKTTRPATSQNTRVINEFEGSAWELSGRVGVPLIGCVWPGAVVDITKVVCPDTGEGEGSSTLGALEGVGSATGVMVTTDVVVRVGVGVGVGEGVEVFEPPPEAPEALGDLVVKTPVSLQSLKQSPWKALTFQK